MLRISLLGVLRLEVDGAELTPPSSRRARLLLAMLALQRRPHSREEVAARLWPDVSDASARVSLRTALAQLRSALGPHAERFLEVSRERLALAGPDRVWTDVDELERLLADGQVDAALELWRGELLTGLEDDWVYERRDELREHLSEALGRVAALAEARGDTDSALLLSRRRAALDPLAEEPQRELIRRLASAGDRAAALSVYERLSERLRGQLRSVPSPATRQLAEAVRSRAVPADGTAANGRAYVAVEDEPAGPRPPIRLPLPRSLGFSAGTPFVGRQAELARLRELWATVSSGQRPTVFLAGEPGIGKTRLAAEFARSVHGDGALVLYGRCEEGLAVPYQPFVEALRPYAGALGADGLRAVLGAFAPQLAWLLPELDLLGEAPRSDPESERFALFESVAALVEAAARAQHALVVLDDLHWAATPTLLMLRHLLRSQRTYRAMLLATYRDTELDAVTPLARLLADLQRESSAQILTIGGLNERSIASLLEPAPGPAAGGRAGELAHVLRNQTAGNPLFIRELLAHLCESGAIGGAEEHWMLNVEAAQLRVPEELRHVVRQRVGRLSEPTRQVLNVAAVAGSAVSFAVLEHVLGDELELLDALDEGLAAGLLAETGADEYAFVHALVGQMLYAQLSAARRARLHRQVGDALEALDADAHVEALAHHFAEAAGDGRAEKAGRYALAAGSRARARLGYEEAAAHYERGLEALARAARPNDRQRFELLIALGEVRWSAGEMPAARAACLQAAALAGQLADSSRLARAVLVFAGPLRFEPAGRGHQSVELLEKALSALGEEESAPRARLMGRLAAALTSSGQEERKHSLARQALAMARRLGDKAALADVLAATHTAIRGPDNVDESLTMAAELACLAAELGEARLEVDAHEVILNDLLELGDFEGSRAQLEALERHASGLREGYARWVATLAQARQAHLDGRLDECEALAQRARALWQGEDELATHAFVGQMVLVRREQGRLDELEQTVERFVALYPELPAWRCIRAFVYAELGRKADARHELEVLAENDFADLPRDALWLLSVALLCEVVAFLSDARRAEVLYGLLLPYGGRCVVAGAARCLGAAARALGLLATTMSRLDDAARHFEDALQMNMRTRCALWVAHTQHDYAHMLLRRGEPGDDERARELLAESLATAEALGLTALEERARRLELDGRSRGGQLV